MINLGLANAHTPGISVRYVYPVRDDKLKKLGGW